MRYRRIMFGLIPDRFKDLAAEKEYIAKFLRLVEYLEKLREKDDSQSSLAVKIISSDDEVSNRIGDDVFKLRRGTTDEMIRLTVQLRKGKRDRDPFEWIEIAIDSTFDTSRSYRIMFNWLAASSPKVDAQVQLLYRRCTQYGLRITTFPHSTVSRNLFIHPVRIKDEGLSFPQVCFFYSKVLNCFAFCRFGTPPNLHFAPIVHCTAKNICT